MDSNRQELLLRARRKVLLSSNPFNQLDKFQKKRAAAIPVVEPTPNVIPCFLLTLSINQLDKFQKKRAAAISPIPPPLNPRTSSLFVPNEKENNPETRDIPPLQSQITNADPQYEYAKEEVTNADPQYEYANIHGQPMLDEFGNEPIELSSIPAHVMYPAAHQPGVCEFTNPPLDEIYNSPIVENYLNSPIDESYNSTTIYKAPIADNSHFDNTSNTAIYHAPIVEDNTEPIHDAPIGEACNSTTYNSLANEVTPIYNAPIDIPKSYTSTSTSPTHALLINTSTSTFQSTLINASTTLIPSINASTSPTKAQLSNVSTSPLPDTTPGLVSTIEEQERRIEALSSEISRLNSQSLEDSSRFEASVDAFNQRVDEETSQISNGKKEVSRRERDLDALAMKLKNDRVYLGKKNEEVVGRFKELDGEIVNMKMREKELERVALVFESREKELEGREKEAEDWSVRVGQRDEALKREFARMEELLLMCSAC
jgi:hypothetical protein